MELNGEIGENQNYYFTRDTAVQIVAMFQRLDCQATLAMTKDVIANAVKQSMMMLQKLDCHAALAVTVEGRTATLRSQRLTPSLRGAK
jgi:hypothetical protein